MEETRAMRTFAQYIRAARATDDPRGDFIADAKAEIRADRFPRVEGWEDLRAHLRTRRACPGAVRAAAAVWDEYEAALLLPARSRSEP
jgi:hypothetical protein